MIRYTKSNSAELQESFVLNVLKEKRSGTYVELGSAHPIIENNTYLLETEFGWDGIAFEIDSNLANLYNSQRRNTCINQDALKFDFMSYFKENHYPKQIDFLQVDVDKQPRNANLMALINMPLAHYRFSVIVFEHNYINEYTYDRMRDAQREVLTSFGYQLVVQTGLEDWWVDPYAVDYNVYRTLYNLYPPYGWVTSEI